MSVLNIITALADFQDSNHFVTGDEISDDTNLKKLKNTSRILALTADNTLIVQEKPGFFTRIKEFLFGSELNRDLNFISNHVIDALKKTSENELKCVYVPNLKQARVALEVLLARTTDGNRKMEFTPVFRLIDKALAPNFRADLMI